jgi:hypothetical protein
LGRHSRKRTGTGSRPTRTGPDARSVPTPQASDRGSGTAATGAARPGATGDEPALSRSQRRDAEARAALAPLAPGERPGAIIVGAVVAMVLGGVNVIAFAAGAKIGGKHPAAGGVVVFALLMFACAIGLWKLWYGAVLAFMALLAIITMLFALLLIEASNLLGFLVPPVVIASAGYLFYRLVRVLGRIQMPSYPGR